MDHNRENVTADSEIQKPMFANILSLVYDIIRNLERDSSDPAQKTNQYQEVSNKILELHKRLEQCRAQVQQLPGIEYSIEEQLQRLRALYQQLHDKCQLITKYRNCCSFDMQKF